MPSIACRLGHESIVAKRANLPYEAGQSKRWLKINNPTRHSSFGRRIAEVHATTLQRKQESGSPFVFTSERGAP